MLRIKKERDGREGDPVVRILKVNGSCLSLNMNLVCIHGTIIVPCTIDGEFLGKYFFISMELNGSW